MLAQCGVRAGTTLTLELRGLRGGGPCISKGHVHVASVADGYSTDEAARDKAAAEAARERAVEAEKRAEELVEAADVEVTPWFCLKGS